MTFLHAPARLLALAALVVGAAGFTGGAAEAQTPPPARHIGSTALNVIRAEAADALAAHPGCAFLTNDRLTATALATIYKESGSGLTRAPSPMTLSRYDVYRPGGSYYQQLNYGLYAFRDASTPYQRAFWHPGVGLWQLDEAGLGVNYAANQRISTTTSSTFVVDYLADRWCSPSSPSSELEGRLRAWGDWGCRQSPTNSSCLRLRELYEELHTERGLDRLIVDPIADLGGASARTCRFGDGSQMPCTYVDPGAAQGDTWWRGDLAGATPIAAPFYVTTWAGEERRHWLKEDTGYAIDITAFRTIGRNSRPTSSLDGIRWTSSSTLCDVTASRGRCTTSGGNPGELVPPPPIDLVRHTVPVDRQPVVGDFDGDDLDDIVWYGPGALSDSVWLGQGNGAFTTQATTVAGVYQPVVASLAADGRDDVLWHEPDTGRVVRWDATGGGAFVATVFTVPVGSTPLVGDFDGDGRDEVHWYGKGDIADLYWDVVDNTVVVTSRSVRGAYLPRVGDFDGNDVDDVLWYGPGSRPDSLWMYAPGGGRMQVITSIGGNFRPTVADLDGDGRSDLYLYTPGPGADTIWYGVDGRTWDARSQPISGTYQLVPADLDLDGADELVLYQAGTGADHYWQFGPGRTLVSKSPVRIGGTYLVVPGRFGTPGSAGLLWDRTTGSDAAVWHP
jgi:hypothetical protein